MTSIASKRTIALADFSTTASTTSTDGTVNTLYSATVPAGAVARPGDKLMFEFNGTLAAHATATRRLAVQLGSQAVYGPIAAAVAVTAGGYWQIRGYVMATGDATAVVTSEVLISDATGTVTCHQVSTVAWTPAWTSDITMYLKAQAAGTGAAAADISATSGYLLVMPAA
ncbi:MAG: hypothetical protein KA755_09055 [Candidatus Microthrix sp.]|nr:hypothetical protein [Candidatus Microthrix sp.]